MANDIGNVTTAQNEQLERIHKKVGKACNAKFGQQSQNKKLLN